VTQAHQRRGGNAPRVYVDDAFVAGDWGFWTGGGHLQADTPTALHEFAGRLGLKREWFQSRPGRPDRDHYDLTRSGRERAIALGAIAETVREGNARRRAVRAAHERR
jgi:uncharacterized protein DUF4031